ncbi:MAG: glucose-6-phosphate isomerase [bacterium]
MENLKINIERIFEFVSKEDVFSYQEEVKKHIKDLENKTGKGNDYVGWVNLPGEITEEQLTDIEEVASELKNKIEIIVVAGIGGSYLGAKAIQSAIQDTFAPFKGKENGPHIIFAGHNIGEDYLSELLNLLETKEYGIVCISKSGTTTETAIAFRILKEHLEKKVGKQEASSRIIAITDANKGALRTLANQEGYKSYVIPDDVGGRYSVLTPVGLVPLAIGGFNIRELVQGAKDMQKNTGSEVNFEENPAAIYAAARNALYKKGKKIELLANYNDKLHYLAEWWKQLYGESEGKENKGIYPASVDFTTDLHSMGQYIQEGERHLMETVISITNPSSKVTIPSDSNNLDKLNYISSKRVDYVNKMAELGTMLAHVEGGVPNIKIELPKLNEYYLGQIMYFFEIGCGISGYILGVNPFDQPGVEAYKKNMFALLGKPGFEEETKSIKAKLG